MKNKHKIKKKLRKMFFNFLYKVNKHKFKI